MRKIDPYKSRDMYMRWKSKAATGIAGLTDACREEILRFLEDMELGRNTGRGAKKGPRSYLRLQTLQQRLSFIGRHLKARGVDRLTGAQEVQIHRLFKDMREGILRKRDGGSYVSVCDYVKVFKTFWHWHMKVKRKEGIQILDICEDLDSSLQRKPPWVFLTEKDVHRLCQQATFKYRVLMMFIYDSGIRCPTELLNVRRSDLSADCRELSVREETSKTFGRRVKLLKSADLLREWTEDQELQADDQVFPISPSVANRYLKRLGSRVLGEATSPGGETYSKLTMYDFRHSSACYWVQRYPSESGLKYRFGWRRSEMIHYYTEYIGMRDPITSEDLSLRGEQSALQQKLESSEQARRVLEEELAGLRKEMASIAGEVRTIAAGAGWGAG